MSLKQHTVSRSLYFRHIQSTFLRRRNLRHRRDFNSQVYSRAPPDQTFPILPQFTLRKIPCFFKLLGQDLSLKKSIGKSISKGMWTYTSSDFFILTKTSEVQAKIEQLTKTQLFFSQPRKTYCSGKADVLCPSSARAAPAQALDGAGSPWGRLFWRDRHKVWLEGAALVSPAIPQQQTLQGKLLCFTVKMEFILSIHKGCLFSLLPEKISMSVCLKLIRKRFLSSLFKDCPVSASPTWPQHKYIVYLLSIELPGLYFCCLSL